MDGWRGVTAVVVATVVAIAAGFSIWWWIGSQGLGGADDVAQVALGRGLYAAQCARCHGDHLQGQPDWQVRRPDGTLPAPPHDASGHSWHHDDDYLFAVTKHGLARFAPPDYRSDMPSFIGILSDTDIHAVIAFIKSTWPQEIRQRQDSLNRR